MSNKKVEPDGQTGADMSSSVEPSNQALSVVAGWMGLSVAGALEETGPSMDDGDTVVARPQYLGLGAKFIPHKKGVAFSAAFDTKLKRRLERSKDQGKDSGRAEGTSSKADRGNSARDSVDDSDDEEGEERGRAAAFAYKGRPQVLSGVTDATEKLPEDEKGQSGRVSSKQRREMMLIGAAHDNSSDKKKKKRKKGNGPVTQ